MNYSKEWQAKAQRILRREKGSLLTIDTLTEFITVHANNFCDGELLKLLREELDKATEWVTQLIESGYTQGNPSLTISYEKVNQLLREGKEELCVDVSEYLESIATATKTYCFCRQLYHGEMIGCDQCEEWYHLPCIGMTAMQAEKCEQYVCLRCMIKDLYFQTGIKMAKTTNKWMSVELQKSRDNHTAKVCYFLQLLTYCFSYLSTSVV